MLIRTQRSVLCVPNTELFISLLAIIYTNTDARIVQENGRRDMFMVLDIMTFYILAEHHLIWLGLQC